tara:strand:- start:4 stop:468 length:465 start_codon:yes stop_codon:yes gene_type:complete
VKDLRWDIYGLREARLSASMSKDPSKKVGAAIFRPDGTLVSKGWNGFPRGCDDDPEIYNDKPRKLLRVVHAEANAIVAASAPLHGCTLFVSPLQPCATCTGLIIQSGITRVVTDQISTSASWESSFAEARAMFDEAGVVLSFMTLPDDDISASY